MANRFTKGQGLFGKVTAQEQKFNLPAAKYIDIDADSEDRTAAYVMNFDVGVNSANCNVINATIDIGTLLSAGEVVKGCYFDMNEAVVNANTSALIGYDATITGLATARSDIVAYKVTFDGTKNGGDTTKGLLIDGNQTINNGSEYLYGTHVDFSGLTQTEGVVYGDYIDVSATVTAGSAYGSYYKLSAAATGIYIDAGTTDHTGSAIIDVNLDINSASCNLINATIDIGTLLSAGEVVKGCFFDVTEAVVNEDTSSIVGYDITVTGFATSRNDIIGFRATFDGTKNGGDTTKGILIDSDQTINNASEYVYGAHIDFSGVTQTEGVLYGEYIDISAAVTAGSSYGSYYKLSAAGVGIYIDAGTTDHTAGNIIDVNLDINSASVNLINATIDIGTLLSAAEVVKGCYFDINEAVANTNTSVIVAYDTTMTGFATSANDLIGYRVTLDGTKSGGDTTRAFEAISTATINNGSEYVYGVNIDLSGMTHTNGIVYGQYVNVSATVSAGSAYGAYYALSAAATGIYIDAGTNDHTSGNIIDVNLDVNSASCNLINATIDIGTILSAAEIVKGCYFDINEAVVNEDTSGIIGYDVLMTGFATSRNDLTGYKVAFDGTKNGGDVTKGLLIDGDQTINNASEYVYGVHVDFSGLTQSEGVVYGQYIDISQTVTAGTSYGSYYKMSAAGTAIKIDADTIDRTGNLIDIDVGVNSASCNVINAAIDIGTLLSAAEVVKGCCFDINEAVVNEDTSIVLGYDVTITGLSTARSDIVAYRATFDGTKDGGDTCKGLLIDGNQTINNGSEYVYGAHIDLSGLTHTNGIIYGQYIDVSAAVASGSAYGSYYKLSAAAKAIHIDAGTTDHTAGDVIYADIDVNSASVNGISFDIDVGTALSGGETVNGLSIDVDGNAGDATNSAMNGIYITSANTTTGVNTAINIQGTFDKSVNIASTAGRMDIDVEIDNRGRFTIFDDFLYQAITENDTPWILNKGNDGQALDPAINAQEFGVIRLTTGDADGTTANDGSQLVCHIPVQADSGGLVFECRLHINTAVTDISVIAGLTDSTALEEAFTIGALDAITAVADDAACFVYDTDAATDEWFACAVDGTTADSGNGTTGTAPVTDTYQTLRIEVSSDGATIKYFINGTLVKTLSGDAGVSPDVNLYATVIACATTTTSKTVDVDYVYVGHNR